MIKPHNETLQLWKVNGHYLGIDMEWLQDHFLSEKTEVQNVYATFCI